MKRGTDMVKLLLSTILLLPLPVDTYTVTGKFVSTRMLLLWPVTQFIVENSTAKMSCRVSEDDYGKAIIGTPFQCKWRKTYATL